MLLKFITVFVILNSFNPELQLKDNESAIKSKLIELLDSIKRFYIRDIIFRIQKEKM